MYKNVFQILAVVSVSFFSSSSFGCSCEPVFCDRDMAAGCEATCEDFPDFRKTKNEAICQCDAVCSETFGPFSYVVGKNSCSCQ